MHRAAPARRGLGARGVDYVVLDLGPRISVVDHRMAISTVALLVLLDYGSATASLPMPSRLMVEYLPEPAPGGGEVLTVSTLRPRFSFVPHAQHEHPGSGVAMRAYRIVVESITPGRGGIQG